MLWEWGSRSVMLRINLFPLKSHKTIINGLLQKLYTSKVDVVSMIYLKISRINHAAAKGEDAHSGAIPHSYYSSF